MNALRVLASPRVWISIAGVVVVLSLLFYAYLTAIASPTENLKDLPVALVNEDEGGELGGESVELGDQVVERVTGPDSPADGIVTWTRPDTRKDALEGLGQNEFYGAIVIPKDYTATISTAAIPPEIPLAIVNEDEGAEMQGEPTKLGAEVVKRITGPDSPDPGFVQWKQLDNRQAALNEISRGEVYAAIVIPKDYSKTLASMSGPPPGSQGAPPPGASSGPPPGAPSGPPPGAEMPEPEPAKLELLTSPSVRPATTGAVEDAFEGIVGGVSGATSERILGGLAEGGGPVPPPAAAVISDPVRGKVSKANVSDEVGPLPKAPKPAEIEVLSNPSAGPSASAPVQNISTGIVQGVSQATSERLSEAAGEQGARLSPEVAAVIGDPVRANVTEAEPVGDNSGNGQSPFFLAFLANLAGFGGAAVVFFGVAGVADGLASRGMRPSQTGLWTVMVLLGGLYTALVAGAEVGVAFGVVGVDHEAGLLSVFLFLVLAIAAIMAVVMVLMALFGAAGIGIAAVFGVLLGLVSAGGLAPIEALPGFYQAYADWLPLRYINDGLRSLLFFDGRSAAGLGDAFRVLGGYLVGAVVLGYLVAFIKDLVARQKGRKVSGEVGEASSG
ncbi:MAG: ABC transporter permease [Rubrobacteraceae bacterium]